MSAVLPNGHVRCSRARVTAATASRLCEHESMSTCVQLQYYPSTLLCYISLLTWWQNIKLINTERGPNIYDRDYIVVQLTKITLLYKIKALAYLTRVVKFCLVGNDDEGSGGGVGQNQ